MRFLSTALLLTLATASHAQTILWDKTIGGTQNEFMSQIRETADGGIVVGGYTWSGIGGDKTEPLNGPDDYWVVKLGASGNIVWQNAIGGSGSDQLFSLVATSDSGVVIGGRSNSPVSGDKTEPDSNTDFWVLKLDVSGNIVWQNTIGGSSYESLSWISNTSDGGFICGGSSQSNISGDKTEDCKGGLDYWIVKIDSLGQVIWDKTIGGSSSDVLTSVFQTSDGGFLCFGYSMSGVSFDKSEPSYGFNDFWVVKLDVTGNIQWQKTIGGSAEDYSSSAIQTSDGGFLCFGESESGISGNKTESPIGAFDYWIVKLDAAGNMLWQNTIGGQSVEYVGKDVIQTADNGFLLSGRSNSPISGDKSEFGASYDFWLVKTDSAGHVMWENSVIGNLNDNGVSVILTSDGNMALGSWSSSNAGVDKSENSRGVADYWVVKLNGNFNQISGKLFADINGNNIQDSGEPPLTGITVTEATTGIPGVTTAGGNYTVLTEDTGSFSVSPVYNLPYYNFNPAVHTAAFSVMNQSDLLNDFAFQPTGTFNDLCVTLSPLTLFRSGQQASYKIDYTNHGTTTLSPAVVLYPDDALTFVTSTPPAGSVNPDSVVFTLPSLNPFESGSVTVTFLIDQGLTFGTLLTSSVKVLPVSGDADPGCNFDTLVTTIIGSFDPNDIQVDRDTLYTFETVNPPLLEYLIRFQNTGNDTAFYVRVNNKISPLMDLASLELVATSHECVVNWMPYDTTLRFTFNNILLPDSNVNEQESHGFVRYRMRPKSNLVAGSLIPSTAYIYFDYNAPVETNTATTEIVLPTSLSSVNESDRFFLYPNPASAILYVQSNSSRSDSHTRVFDSRGSEIRVPVLMHTPEPGVHSLNLSRLPAGLYFITVDGVSAGKFIRQ